MTKIKIALICALCFVTLLLLVGCADSDDPRQKDSGPPDDSDGECSVPGLDTVCNNVVSAGQTVFLTSNHGYTYTSNLTINTVPVQPRTNLIFDWSTLTQDFLMRPLDPLNDTDMVLLSIWNIPSSEITRLINTDQMKMDGFLVAAESYTNNASTSVAFLDFTVQGAEQPDETMLTYMDNTTSGYDPATWIHMLTVASGRVQGRGVRMVTYLTLDPTSTTTTVNVTNDSTQLSFEVDMRSLTRLALPVGAAGLVSVDWSTVETNPVGYPFEPFGITRAVIARFPLENICEVEAKATNLEAVSDQWYSTAVTEGTGVAFSSLTLKTDPANDPTLDPLADPNAGAGGPAFQGIDNTGVWILALYCGMCTNPVPKFVTVLHPCGA